MAYYERGYYRDGGQRPPMMGRLGPRSAVTWLLALNFIVFLIDSILGGSRRAAEIAPALWGNFNVEQGVEGLELWRWVTYQFVHADFFHVLFNMIGLYFFGPLMESWWGKRRFVAFYVLCGMSGAFVFTALVYAVPELIFDVAAMEAAGVSPADIPLVGASGSLFGILIGCAVINPNMRVMLLIPPVPMKMRTMALLFLGIAAVSVIAGARNAGGEAAHLGGALLGFVLVRWPVTLAWANRLSIQGIRERSAERKARSQARHEVQTEEEIDRILAKVSREGIHSLTEKEKRVMQQATERRRGGF